MSIATNVRPVHPICRPDVLLSSHLPVQQSEGAGCRSSVRDAMVFISSSRLAYHGFEICLPNRCGEMQYTEFGSRWGGTDSRESRQYPNMNEFYLVLPLSFSKDEVLAM
jgi:hypothetical protein